MVLSIPLTNASGSLGTVVLTANLSPEEVSSEGESHSEGDPDGLLCVGGMGATASIFARVLIDIHLAAVVGYG